MKIRQKMTLLVVLPLVAVLAFAALAVFASGSAAIRADQLQGMVSINAQVGALTHELQAERTVAVQMLTGDKAEDVTGDFASQTGRTDKALSKYDQVRAEHTALPDDTARLLDQADSNLRRIDSIRERVEEGNQTAAAVAFAYRIAVADLLAYGAAIPQAGGAPSDVADRIRASTLLAQASEYASLKDAAVLRAIDKGPLSEMHYGQIVQADSASEESRLSFSSLASTQWRSWLEQSRNGTEMIAAQTLNEEAIGTPPGDEVNVAREDWLESAAQQTQQRASVQSQVDEEIVTAVEQWRGDQLWWTTVQIVAVALVVVVAIVMALRLGGPVVQGLRRLSTTAHQVATVGLPRAVAELDDDHEVMKGRSPEQFARQAAPPIDVRGRDELADVGKAFNEVHQEAIRVAAGQALLRVHIGSMFVRLARRGHSLAGRLTSALDEAERNENDPTRLERLFALDHMVTLFARTNDSLLVLGGAAPAKVRKSNETVANILTAAQGQIEQYTRVRIEAVDVTRAVTAGAVDDVVKLLAELLDNATQYSNYPVSMVCSDLSDRVIVQISDRGIGIKPEKLAKLNTKLASKTVLGLESVQAMGLTVVSHLAARHRVRVQLRPTAEGGIVAEVSLPAALLETPESPQSSPAAATPRRRAPLFDVSNKTRRPTPGTQPEKVQAVFEPGGDDAVRSVDSRGLPVRRYESVKVGTGRSDEIHPIAHTEITVRHRRPRLLRAGAPEGEERVSDGWARAASVSQSAASASEDDGLPRRTPMAQLVPGAMDDGEDQPASMTRRDPSSVRATYLAYSRGRAGSQVPDVTANAGRDAI